VDSCSRKWVDACGVAERINVSADKVMLTSGGAQMKVEVKFFTSLREITGKKVEEIQLDHAITVKELLTLLSDKYGERFREYLYTREGQVQGFLSFLLNGKNINALDGFDTELKDGDVLAIIPPVGGG